jgi:hypothetical protein
LNKNQNHWYPYCLDAYITTRLTKSERAPPKVSNSKVKDQRVKVMVSNERSCQKEYTYESSSIYQSKVMSKVKGFEKVKFRGSRSWYEMKGLAISKHI